MGEPQQSEQPPLRLPVVPLDDLDRKIVDSLRRDGRIPFRALGDEIGLSANATADRVRGLLRRGVITRFTAIVDDRATGRSLEAVVDLRLAHEGQRAALEETLRELPAVVDAVHLTGPFDYQLRLACNDASEIDATIAHIKRRGFVRDTQTRVILRQVM
jgi:Lrp/AsnC family transcriptional regulator, leucine-responsive regulatory protein